MSTFIGDIVEPVPCVSRFSIGKEVDKIFCHNNSIQGIVVVNAEVPISLITRTDFYQKLGTLYGYNIYIGRPIELIVKKKPLIVDYYQSIMEVSRLAMERKDDELYDYVIITKDEKYFGVVSVQRLLMKLVEVQVEFASYLNPLTRLPGNHIIEEKLKEIIHQEEFSILYFDLDHFKTYNDTYGFKKGDELLIATAEILKEAFVKHSDFLGHIGGDDFIGVLNHFNFISLCKTIINAFEQIVKNFYNSSHLALKSVIAENRKGVKEKIPLVSLSVAVVTNQYQFFESIEELVENAANVKKSCKKISGSCYLTNKPLLSRND